MPRQRSRVLALQLSKALENSALGGAGGLELAAMVGQVEDAAKVFGDRIGEKFYVDFTPVA